MTPLPAARCLNDRPQCVQETDELELRRSIELEAIDVAGLFRLRCGAVLHDQGSDIHAGQFLEADLEGGACATQYRQQADRRHT